MTTVSDRIGSIDLESLSSSLPRQAAPSGIRRGTRSKALGPGIRHLVARTTFGASNGELDVADNLGVSGWIDYQLAYQQIDDGELEDLLNSSFPTLSQSYAEILAALDAGEEVNTAAELIIATIVRQLYSPRQLYELMVEFWTNHFNVFLLDGPVQYLKTGDDRDNIRPYALGRFSDLLQANARSPAMLFYLDNVSNTNLGPNENYARELMELHTLGVDGGYNEGDVKEVARAFTGWTLSRDREDLFVFNPEGHDFDSKFILETLFSAGQGIEDGEQVLDLLATHPSTARFVSEKLCRRFIADVPPTSIVDRVAQTYLDSDGDITQMMRIILNSEEFMTSEDNKFKRPAEYLNSIVRGLDATLSGDFLRLLFRELERQNQVPFFAEPPTGYSDVSDSWLNSNSLLSRWNFGFAVAFGNVPVVERVNDGQPDRPPLLMSDLIELPIESMLGSARTPLEIVDQLVEIILNRPVDRVDRDALTQFASSGGPANQQLELDQAIDGARRVIAGILASRYFQFR